MKRLNIGCGKSKFDGFINIDIDPKWEPDMVMDISSDLDDRIARGTFDLVVAHDVLEHVSNLPKTMTNCLDLLKDGAMMDIIVPYDLSYGAWQDPTHVRAFNEKSWLYYYDWCWYLGWFDYGLKMLQCKFFVIEGDNLVEKPTMSPNVPRSIDVMRVTLRKEKL